MLNNIKTKRLAPHHFLGKEFSQIKTTKSSGGFTILEVLVAVLVVTVGVLAAFNVAQNITVFSRINTSRLTATYLAQEGIELVRNQRDNNWLQGSNWDDIDMSLIGCATTSILEKFDRICTFSTSTDGFMTWMNVSSTVFWQEKGTTHSVINATELYKWLYP